MFELDECYFYSVSDKWGVNSESIPHCLLVKVRLLKCQDAVLETGGRVQ